MAFEKKELVTRMIYVATCDSCQEKIIHTENYAKERYCKNCDKWVPFKEESYTGPELVKK